MAAVVSEEALVVPSGSSHDIVFALLIFISRMILYLSSNPLSKILEHLKVNFSKDSVSQKTILEIVTIGQI